MPNPWHDAAGRFCSQDELQSIIKHALQTKNYAVYERERRNMERIEALLAEEAQQSPNYIQIGEDENLEWTQYQAHRKDHGWVNLNQDYLINENIDSFTLENTYKEGSDHVLQHYSVCTTTGGLEELKSGIEYARSQNQGLSLKAPNVRLFRILVRKETLLLHKRNAAKYHRAWKEQISRTLNSIRGTEDKKFAIQNLLFIQRTKLEELRTAFTEAQFNYHYLLSGLTDANFVTQNGAVAVAVFNLQQKHDDFVFTDLKVQELAKLM